MRFLTAGIALFLSGLPALAHAHLVSTRFGDFYNGLLHPLLSLAQVLPWLALGLLAGLQPVHRARNALLIFPCAVLAGCFAAPWLADWTGWIWLNWVSLLLCGAGVVLALKMPFKTLAVLMVVMGFSHGVVSAEVLLSGKQRLLFLAGVTCAAYIFITLLTALSFSLVQRFQWGHIAVRALGSWVVAVGIVFVAYSFSDLSSNPSLDPNRGSDGETPLARLQANLPGPL